MRRNTPKADGNSMVITMAAGTLQNSAQEPVSHRMRHMCADQLSDAVTQCPIDATRDTMHPV